MKRSIALCLALCLLVLLTFGVMAKGERRFYVTVTPRAEGGWRAEICWDGAAEEDRVSAIRFRLSYPDDKLVCKENGIGDALRAFSIRMGPQYPHSNPAGFVGAEINHAVTEAGVLGYFVFEAADGASGKAELKLELQEAIRLDNSDCVDLFTVQNAVIDLESKEKPIDCTQTGIGHVPGAWQTDPEQKGRLVKKCGLCGAICEEKQVESTTTEPVKKEEVTLRPGKQPLPEKARLSVTKTDETPSDGLLMEVAGAFDLSKPEFLGGLRIELTLDDEKLELSEDATLSVPAPTGAADGDEVLVVLLHENGDGVRETYRATVEAGEVKLPARTFGTLYFFAAEKAIVEETPETEPDETPETVPEGPSSNGNREEPTDETEEGSPALTIALITLGAVLAASAAVVFVKKKQTSASLDEAQTKQGEPESETEGSVGVTPEEKE